MKLVVPLTMPSTRLTLSPANDSRSGRSRGIGAPTRAARSWACSCSSRTTCDPTTPQPSRAMRTGRAVMVMLHPLPGSSGRRSFCPVCGGAARPGNGTCARLVGVRLEPEQVVDGFAAHHHPRDAVTHGNDGRPTDVVVVAGQRTAVRAGHRDGNEVTGCDVCGQRRIAHDDVTRLAMLADHPAQRRRGGTYPVGKGAGVAGVVERGAHVVAHPAVDTHIGAHHV